MRKRGNDHRAITLDSLPNWVVRAIGEGLENYGVPRKGYRAWMSPLGDVQVALAPEHDKPATNAALQGVMAAIQAWLDYSPTFCGEALRGPRAREFQKVTLRYLRPHKIDPKCLLPTPPAVH